MQGTGTGQNDEALSSLLSLLRSNSSANDTEVRVSE
jgi:thioredoxin-like negative regulator of GroEL